MVLGAAAGEDVAVGTDPDGAAAGLAFGLPVVGEEGVVGIDGSDPVGPAAGFA